MNGPSGWPILTVITAVLILTSKEAQASYVVTGEGPNGTRPRSLRNRDNYRYATAAGHALRTPEQ